jgi:hypothetical protein
MRSTCAFRVLTLSITAVVVSTTAISALGDPPADALSAAFSIVGTVNETRPARRRSSFGDEIIVTTAIIRVGETLRGKGPAWLALEVEGGTINDITMEASDTPLLNRGDRAVFLIDRLPDGRFVPHRRGSGILRLQADDHIRDSTLTLADVRRLASEAR